MSGSYDLLRNTWIYVEIKQEVMEEIQQQQLAALRCMLMEIVQGRFPRIKMLAQSVIENVSNTEILQELIVKVGIARTEKEVRLSLSEVASVEQATGPHYTCQM